MNAATINNFGFYVPNNENLSEKDINLITDIINEETDNDA